MILSAELDLMDELDAKIENLRKKIAMVKTVEVPEDLSKELDEAYQELNQAYKRAFTTNRTRSQ